MTIRVDTPKENGNGRFRLFLPVPLGLLSTRFALNFIPREYRQYSGAAHALVRALKEYKRLNGSWNLVEVESGDTHVLIRI